jgi:hypothetical protein
MNWIKTSPWGNYLDPEQNHKPVNMRNQMIIRQVQALKLDGKHAGSKPIGRLLRNIRFYSRTLNMMFELKPKVG